MGDRLGIPRAQASFLFLFFFFQVLFFSFLFFFTALPARACVQVVTSRAVAAARLLEQKKKREDVPVEHARRLTLFL